MLGHIELLTGHHRAAADLLRPLPERLLNGGHPHGIAYMTWVDTIEALAAVGEIQALRCASSSTSRSRRGPAART